jgi:hypothetical protein
VTGLVLRAILALAALHYLADGRVIRQGNLERLSGGLSAKVSADSLGNGQRAK